MQPEVSSGQSFREIAAVAVDIAEGIIPVTPETSPAAVHMARELVVHTKLARLTLRDKAMYVAMTEECCDEDV